MQNMLEYNCRETKSHFSKMYKTLLDVVRRGLCTLVPVPYAKRVQKRECTLKTKKLKCYEFDSADPWAVDDGKCHNCVYFLYDKCPRFKYVGYCAGCKFYPTSMCDDCEMYDPPLFRFTPVHKGVNDDG